MDAIRRLAPYVAHLRLPFQATLAPIFLWGALLSGGSWDGGTTAAFVALHLFLYPAATAFNSAYDRDVGPVGGLEAPPEVPPRLLGFALTFAALGTLPAFWAGWPFPIVYCLIAGWTAAYSHPRTRWKASPCRSAAAIALGQGALGFLAGWLATASPDAAAGTLVAGAVGTGFTALGFYPATQVYQIDEDRRRGDRTMAVVLGAAGALRLGSLCLVAAAGVTAWLAAGHFGPSDAVLIALGFAALVLMQMRPIRRPTYRRSMRLLNAGTGAFLLFIALEAIGRG
jgi:1,4-dihydroxy-2-naphthoate octaprenyltransferase